MKELKKECETAAYPFCYERKNKKLVIKKEAEIGRLSFGTYLETGSINEVYDFFKEKI